MMFGHTKNNHVKSFTISLTEQQSELVPFFVTRPFLRYRPRLAIVVILDVGKRKRPSEFYSDDGIGSLDV